MAVIPVRQTNISVLCKYQRTGFFERANIVQEVVETKPSRNNCAVCAMTYTRKMNDKIDDDVSVEVGWVDDICDEKYFEDE